MMTRISGITVSPAQTFEPTSMGRELGKNGADVLTSAKVAEEKGEGCLYSLVCFLPRCALAIVKKVICVLTLGCCCNGSSLSEKERREAIILDLRALLKIWENENEEPSVKMLNGEKIFNKYPELKSAIVNFGINDRRSAALNHKKAAATAAEKNEWGKEVEKWNNDHPNIKQEMVENLTVKVDADLLRNYINFLDRENDNSK